MHSPVRRECIQKAVFAPDPAIPDKVGIGKHVLNRFRLAVADERNGKEHGVSIVMTRDCFNRCYHCYENAEPGKPGNLKPEFYPKIIDNVAELNNGVYPRVYQITGGDPMKRPRETLALARELGARAGAKRVQIRTTGIAALTGEGRRCFEELAKLPYVEVVVGLGVFQRKYISEVDFGGDFGKAAGFMKRAFGTLQELFGDKFWVVSENIPREEENQLLSLIDLVVGEVSLNPFGRGADDENRTIATTTERYCTCHSLTYIFYGGEFGKVGLEPTYYGMDKGDTRVWIDSFGGLHISAQPTAPILDLTADKPLETIKPDSFAVNLMYGGPLWVAQEMLGWEPRRITAYWQNGDICRLCYELKEHFHPELC